MFGLSYALVMLLRVEIAFSFIYLQLLRLELAHIWNSCTMEPLIPPPSICNNIILSHKCKDAHYPSPKKSLISLATWSLEADSDPTHAGRICGGILTDKGM